MILSMPSEVPSAPAQLAAAGTTLWCHVVDDFELAPHELVLLEQICHTIDAIDALQRRLNDADVLDERYNGRVHPALPELRAQRLALGRLLGALNIPGLQPEGKPKRRRDHWPNGLTAV
jgi:hypothetical protein